MASSTGKPSRVTRRRLSSALLRSGPRHAGCAGGVVDACGRKAWRSGRGRCPRQPQAHQQELVALRLGAPGARPRSRHGRRASTRSSHVSGTARSIARSGRVPVDQPRMRAGADAGIFAVAPVDEVVPALRARAGHGWRSRRPAGRASRRPRASSRTARGPRPASGTTSLPASRRRSNRVPGSMVSW